MTPEQRRERIRAILALLKAEAERLSIREVAQQVGMSHGGVFNLLNNPSIQPYGKTIQKLERWYTNRGPALQERQEVVKGLAEMARFAEGGGGVYLTRSDGILLRRAMRLLTPEAG